MASIFDHLDRRINGKGISQLNINYILVISKIGEDAMAKLNTKIVMLEGEQGKDGTNIKSVEKSASDGLTE